LDGAIVPCRATKEISQHCQSCPLYPAGTLLLPTVPLMDIEAGGLEWRWWMRRSWEVVKVQEYDTRNPCVKLILQNKVKILFLAFS